MSKLFHETLVDRVTEVLDRGSTPDDNGRLVVRDFALRLGVNTNQVEVLPDLLHELVEVPLIFCADRDVVRVSVDDVEFLNRDLVYLVQNVDAGHVDPIALNHID